MAQWCVATGFGPDVFLNLTLGQRAAFAAVVNRANRK